jgi:hypothetical protein
VAQDALKGRHPMLRIAQVCQGMVELSSGLRCSLLACRPVLQLRPPCGETGLDKIALTCEVVYYTKLCRSIRLISHEVHVNIRVCSSRRL